MTGPAWHRPAWTPDPRAFAEMTSGARSASSPGSRAPRPRRRCRRSTPTSAGCRAATSASPCSSRCRAWSSGRCCCRGRADRPDRRCAASSAAAPGACTRRRGRCSPPSPCSGSRRRCCRRTSGADVVTSWLQVANWHFLVDGTSYGDLFDGPSAVLHFWSLAIEEQLYLVIGVDAAVVASGSGRPARVLGLHGRRRRRRLLRPAVRVRPRRRSRLLRHRHEGRARCSSVWSSPP